MTKYKHIFAAMLALSPMALSGCGEPTPIAPVKAEAVPTHNYIERDGNKFYYPSAISEDSAQAGQAAGRVLELTYLGNREGLYKFTMEGYSMISCKIPCSVIKAVGDDGQKELIQYDEDSIVGAAFSDAFSGAMEVAFLEKK